MTDSDSIGGMLRDLGLQLAALRRQAGLTQHALAGLAGFSRSAVSLAEIGRQSQAREFWQACDKALDSGGVLAAGADQVNAVREAEQRAAALAAQEARQARALAALDAARQRSGVTARITAVQPCPHCGAQVAVLTTFIAQTATPAQRPSESEEAALPVQTPGP
jgi:transcriptional regulator with XRE-family HTH domain